MLTTDCFTTDQGIPRRSYARVQANLYDPDFTNEEGRPKRIPDLALFEMRGRFLGSVYASIGGEIVGLFCLTECEGRAFVDSGYVAERYRGLGIGSGLLRLACNKLVEMKKTPIHFRIESWAMNRLLDQLITERRYPFEFLVTVGAPANGYDGLRDHLFTPDEHPISDGAPHTANA